ncbi:MAG: UvrB/UvrC motif-containing protein [bacterium]
MSLHLCSICLKQLSVNSSFSDNISSIYVEILISLLSKHITDKYNDINFLSNDEINSWEHEQKDFFELESYEDQYDNFALNINSSKENRKSNTESSIMNLQKRLNSAVKEENYEYAAILRDRISELKKAINRQ